MNTERVRTLLIPALRDPNRKQTRGALRRIGARDFGYQDGDCCLGVACDVSGLGEWGQEPEYEDAIAYLIVDPETGDVYDSQTEDLPGPVREFYGFPDVGGGEVSIDGVNKPLWEHNDEGATFAQIADALEALCDELDGVNRG